MHENDISKIILDAAVEVHKTLGGPGLQESVYEEALAWELKQRGLEVERHKAIPIVYKGQTLSVPLHLDMVVERKVIVECMATPDYDEHVEVQTLTYLRLSGLKLGLIINFGGRRVSESFKRVVNNL